jgi:hypothetical protein
MKQESFLKLFFDRDCKNPCGDEIGNDEPVTAGTTTERAYWLKNTSPNITFSNIKLLSNDADVSVSCLKQILEPFDSARVNIKIKVAESKRTSIKCKLQIQANGLVD